MVSKYCGTNSCASAEAIKIMALSSWPHNTIIFSSAGTVVLIRGYGYFGATNIPTQDHPRPQIGSGFQLIFCHEILRNIS